jgi:hypothetical protein
LIIYTNIACICPFMSFFILESSFIHGCVFFIQLISSMRYLSSFILISKWVIFVYEIQFHPYNTPNNL